MSRPASRTRRVVEIVIAVGALLAIFVWLEGFLSHKIEADSAPHAGGARHEGEVIRIRPSEIPVLREAVGTVRSVKEATISPRISGVIDRFLVDEGDRVREGEDLAILSAREIVAREAAAATAVTSAEVALLQAGSDFERMDRLRAKEAVTRSEWERARTALSLAEAELARARETERAEKAYASYTRLTAPFDGLVVERTMDPGDLASPGTPVLRLIDPSRFRLEAAVHEGAARGLRSGHPVSVVIPALDVEIPAQVSEVVPAADPESRTITVKVDLPAIEGLRTGHFGRLVYRDGTRPGLSVPRDAVRTVGGLHLVTLIDEEGRPVSRYVRIGEEVAPGEVEILSGLREGDRIARGERRVDD